MKHARALAIGLLLLAVPAVAQDLPFPRGGDPLASYSFSFAGPSTIGSDGTLYVATSEFSYAFNAAFAGTTNSKLNAFKLSSSSSTPDATLSFSGFAWVLNIGKSDRVFLGVGNYLYIIPTPFDSGTLERVAADVTYGPLPGPAATTSILKINLNSTAVSLKVQSVGAKEYLYLTTYTYQLSPFKITSKVIILDSSDGSKIREFTVE